MELERPARHDLALTARRAAPSRPRPEPRAEQDDSANGRRSDPYPLGTLAGHGGGNSPSRTMQDTPMPARMKIGEGRINGALSIVFGSIAVGGVLCFHFPELLTTPEFRAEYDVAALRNVLAGCILVAFAFALRSLIANQAKRAGLVGGGLAALSLVLGGAGV